MAQVFRHASVYYRGKKVANFSGFEEQIATGAEDVVSTHGWEGATQGTPLTKLSTDAIIPVGGVGVDVIRDALAQEYVDIGLGRVGDQIHRLRMFVVNATITSNAQTGSLRGRFEFSGPAPELVHVVTDQGFTRGRA